MNEYNKLKLKMNYYMEKYENGTPKISDYEYDMLKQKLINIEKEHPEFISADSPTQKVSSGKSNLFQDFDNIKHDIPMLSIQDVFTKEDVKEWVDKVKSVHPDAEFVVEKKIDGLSASIRYTDGILTVAETRGDGAVGAVVTKNIKTIPEVLKKFSANDMHYLEIRGEVYMKQSSYENLNKKLELAGKKTMENKRNAAAGTLKLLNSEEVAKRGLSMFVFNIQKTDGVSFSTHMEGYSWLKKNGFTTIENPILCKTSDEVFDAIDQIGESRGTLDYDIDGAVIKINQYAYRDDFQMGSKYSSGHIAYKYPPEEKQTKVLDIELAVGRTGKITPVAIFEPVHLCGTTVSRATLHNEDFLKKMDIRIGDVISVYKSGEIIPKIKKVILSKRNKNTSISYVFPKTCPICKEPIVHDKTDAKCINPYCPAHLERTIINFCGRDAMNLKGFGENYIESLIKNEYIKNIADIYNLRLYREELIKNGILGKEKNTDKLLNVIDDSKNNDATLLLTGFGIENVGKSTAKNLMEKFKSIRALSNATISELTSIEDVGDITAKCIYNYFHKKDVQIMLQELQNCGVNMQMKETISDNKFSGKTFVITGTLPTLSRNEMTELIEKNGGKVSGSVSKKTDYVVAGENAGSKLTKAEELNIKIISEEDILKNI